MCRTKLIRRKKSLESVRIWYLLAILFALNCPMYLMQRILALLVIIIAPILGLAQPAPDYISFADNSVLQQQVLDAISKKFQEDQVAVSGKNKKYVVEMYKERYEMIKRKFDDKEIISNAEVNQYLNQLTQEIISQNKNKLPGNIRIQFSRSHWPNASSMGEGTIFFNIGLFTRLQNESQVAFVISHELAHYCLNHSNKSIQRYVETVNSEEFQKELKEIRNSAYGKNSAVEKLALNLSFGSRKHSREFEQSADSMALELMKSTSFDVGEALTTLALLDSVDKDKYDANLKLEEFFNYAEYPFKKKWLNSSSLSFTDTKEEQAKKKLLEDSLKTHPDCKHRIKLLEPKVKEYYSASGKKFVVSETQFNKLKSDFDYEILNYEFESDEVSSCLYHTLQMLQYDKSNPYLMALVGKCLNKIYTAQMNHELGKITDLPNPAFDDEYNSLLRFLQNLRLTELSAISYYFLRQNEQIGKLSEEYVAALIQSKDNFGKPEEKKEWIDYYHKQFQNRKYNF